jgi:hypothetical protein
MTRREGERERGEQGKRECVRKQKKKQEKMNAQVHLNEYPGSRRSDGKADG